MIESIKKFAAKIDARSERERVFIFATCLAVMLLIALNGVWAPMQKKIKQLSQKHQQNLISLQTNQSELELLKAGKLADVDYEVKHQIAEQKKQMLSLRAEVAKFEERLVPAEKMNDLLEQVLSRNKNLRIISMKSLPVENVLSVQEQAAAHAASASAVEHASRSEIGLFKHEVELIFEGNYLDMLSYLKSLEAMPQRLYWGSIHLRVVEYPQSRLSLRVFTVSQERKWLDL